MYPEFASLDIIEMTVLKDSLMLMVQFNARHRFDNHIAQDLLSRVETEIEGRNRKVAVANGFWD